LLVVLTSHHRLSPTQIIVRRRNHCSPKPSNHFCNKIGHQQTCTDGHPSAAFDVVPS
jgi:hypothetical protein